ncbi:hypothetical protein [Antarcticibacterium sp. 1MA-6-2]|nr:hypothetical protein [Antarcticibacterium sp. 1MA-6-2]
MESGEWNEDSGKRRVESGKWRVESGRNGIIIQEKELKLLVH